MLSEIAINDKEAFAKLVETAKLALEGKLKEEKVEVKAAKKENVEVKEEKEIKKISPKICVEIDGGVTIQNANIVRDAGTDVIVAGTSIFKSEDKNKAINIIKGKNGGR